MEPILKNRMYSKQEQRPDQDDHLPSRLENVLRVSRLLGVVLGRQDLNRRFDALDFIPHTFQIGGLEMKAHVREIYRGILHSRQLLNRIFDFQSAGRTIEPFDGV
jgi:hypothetical protein